MFHEKGSMVSLVEFLRAHPYKEQSLMLNDKVQNLKDLQFALQKAQEYLRTLSVTTSYSDMEHKLQRLGLEGGWGDNAQRVSAMINLLLELLDVPDPENLGKFLSRIPLVINVVVMSSHGYFAQDNVLGGQE